MVVAKFNVTQNKVSDNATDANDIALHAVFGLSEENKTFFKWTPSAQINMSCVNPAATNSLKLVKRSTWYSCLLTSTNNSN